MSFSSKDLFTDKIKLIYEFNPGSPLFARVAASIIGQGNITEAIEFLKNGIGLYPDYASAYFVLSLCNAYSGKEEDARNAAIKGADLLESPETLKYYFSRIEQIIEERNSLQETKRRAFITEEQDEQKTSSSIEDRLEILANMLKGAKINYKPDVQQQNEIEIPEYKGQKIATETLANIYFSQKNFKEAISVYRELIKQNPANEEKFSAKIEEISQLIDTGLV